MPREKKPPLEPFWGRSRFLVADVRAAPALALLRNFEEAHALFSLHVLIAMISVCHAQMSLLVFGWRLSACQHPLAPGTQGVGLRELAWPTLARTAAPGVGSPTPGHNQGAYAPRLPGTASRAACHPEPAIGAQVGLGPRAKWPTLPLYVKNPAPWRGDT